MDKRRTDELIVRYVEKLSLYKEYASRIRNLIENLVELEGVESYAINGWAKDPKEFLAAENDDMRDMDLVTVRVLLRFPEDVYRIEDIVRAEFDVDMTRSVPSSGLTDPFRFGYPSVSYVLSLSAPRVNLREWKKYSGLSFRLELRTMLQEVWASIAPRVEQDLPEDSGTKRELGLLAALLEKADNGFLSLRRGVGESAPAQPPKTSASAVGVSAGNVFTDEELYRFFREDPGLISHWNSAALEAGFPPFSPDAEYLRESFVYLCQILRAAGITTMAEVKSFLSGLDTDERGVRQLRAVREAFARKDVAWRVDPFSALFLLVMNFRWDALKDRENAMRIIRRGSDRISGAD